MVSRRNRLLGVALCWASVVATGCAPETPRAAGPLPPTRGYILISIDALGAGYLGAYGGPPGASPFFDSLAARGVLFERTAVQYPSTLTSHLSIFTGLYPAEHGVYPPASALSEAISTLPERFRAAGFRTSGHTEGGFMAGGFGFSRGFDEFTDTPHAAETDIERTFGRGLDFLRRLGERERFFLFLHTYAVHDPYAPPERFRALFAAAEAPAGPEPTGTELRRLNLGGEPPDPVLADHYRALYRGSVRYADAVLERLFTELELLGLSGETTVVITSDHGEEFGEHGRYGHAQLYPEVVFVPLLLVHPAIVEPVRVATLVESIDLAPTLLDLAALAPIEGGSGRSLVPLLRDPRRRRPADAYAEMLEERRHRTLLRDDGGLRQLIQSAPHADPEGTWVSESVSFDAWAPSLELTARSFHRPRRVRLEGPSGRLFEETTIGADWLDSAIRLPEDLLPLRLTLWADGCDVPAALGTSDDERCLSVQVARPPLWLAELYDLGADPAARRTVRDAAAIELLARRLEELRFEPRSASIPTRLPEETVKTLRALGYLD